MNTIQNDLSDVEEPIASGRFAPLLDWLRYVRDKFEGLYDLSELRGCESRGCDQHRSARGTAEARPGRVHSYRCVHL